MTADNRNPADRGFDHRGQRLGGEIDLDNRQLGTTIADMTPADWAEVEELARRWKPEQP